MHDSSMTIVEEVITDSKKEGRGAIPKLKRQTDGFTRQDVVNAFANAFQMIGGVNRLALWANANPDKFYPLYAKLLPSTSIQLGAGASLQIVHAIPPTQLDNHPGEGLEIVHQEAQHEQDMVQVGSVSGGDVPGGGLHAGGGSEER